jgi:tetratricopeptide (TPR) repeat protein
MDGGWAPVQRALQVLLLAGTAAFVMSCASAPPQKAATGKAPLEKAAPEKAPPRPSGSASSQAAARPAAQPRQEAPVEDSLPPEQGAPEQGAPDQPADVALGLPANPAVRPAPLAEPSEPTESSDAEKFPLSAPQLPSKPQAENARTPAAERGSAKPRAEAPRKPAAASRAPQAEAAQGAQQPRVPSAPAAPQPGSSKAVQQPPAASVQAASSPGAQASEAPTYGKLREIYARQGDDVQIGLDGVGFLFLGFPDRSPNGDGMSFKGKDTRDGKTWFSFKALKLGTYDLDFLRQDNTTGTSSKETVRVHVVSDADFAAAVAQGQQQTPGSGETPGDPAFAAKLASLGQYDAAIAELLKGYHDGNPGLNDSLAQLYLRTGAYDAAEKYFTKNLAEQGQYGDSAVLGLAKAAIAQNDQPGLLSLLKRLLAVKDPRLEVTLLAAARFEQEKNIAGLGIDLAGEYLNRYPDGRWRDEADFILGQLLELDSQFRDLARARATYDEILHRYPESAYAARARERIRYINRHFFEIR